MQLTVVICTYQREELLEITLRTLRGQTAEESSYSVVVVDNAGREETRRIAQMYGAKYVLEPKLGHSHARNRGMEHARSAWVLYLDDDVCVPPDLIAKFMDRLSGCGCAALGGQVHHWFRTPPPRWIVRYYNHPMQPSRQENFGTLIGEHYLIGCLFAVRKSAWEAIGGFSDAVGMHGHSVGAGG